MTWNKWQFTNVQTVTAARNALTRKYSKGETLHVGILASRVENRYLVIARNTDGVQASRLLHGPWCRQTARKKAQEFATHLGN